MQKRFGFTIIEVLTTVTILAIVATVAAPEYWRFRDRDIYRSQGQELFDSILDARNAALTNRLCNDGNTSVRWTVFVDTNADPLSYVVRCYFDTGVSDFTVEQASTEMDRSELEILDFLGATDPPAMDGAGEAFPDSMFMSFFSGGVNARLEYDDDLTGSINLNKMNEVQMVIGHLNSDYQHTICFNRVSGFPSFNKTGNTCLDY